MDPEATLKAIEQACADGEIGDAFRHLADLTVWIASPSGWPPKCLPFRLARAMDRAEAGSADRQD